MAKYKLSWAGENMRGAIGSTVISNSLGGLTMRTRVVPANPQTASQVATRSEFTEFTRMWATLTLAQKNAWETYAKTLEYTNIVGNKTKLSGQNAFVAVNMDLAIVGAAPVLLPPPSGSQVNTFASGAASLTLMSGTIAAFTLNLTLLGGAALGMQEKIYARLTPPCSGGEGLNVVMIKATAINTGVPYVTLTPNVLADYTARYGNGIGAYQVIGVGVKIVNAATGKTSPYLRFLVQQNVSAQKKPSRNGNGHRRHTNGSALPFRRKGNGHKLVSK